MSVSCECCVLSGIGGCVGLITRPEESYRVCISVILKPRQQGRPRLTKGCYAMKRKDTGQLNEASTQNVICFASRDL